MQLRRRALIACALLCGTFLALEGSSGRAGSLVPTPIGVGARYHPRAISALVARSRQIGGLRCLKTSERRFGVHLEVFGRGRVVVVPAGVGVAPPWRSVRPHVLTGRCSYAARTRTAIGVIEVSAGRRLTLGQFFEIWGEPLGRSRLVGFRARRGERVRAFVDGARWRGAVRSIPLRRHAAIALELGAYSPPHPSYRFGMGL